MSAALYVTIWAALALFAAGEIGRARLGAIAAAAGWPWRAWVAGVGLCALHFVLAFEVRHDWSHAAAVGATAAQTAAVYGVDAGAGFFVNYVFLGVWAADTWHWRAAPSRHAARPRWLRWTARAFYLIVIVNAAIVFAAGWRRGLGAVVVAAMALSWTRPPRP